MTWLQLIPDRLLAPAKYVGIQAERVKRLEQWLQDQHLMRPTLRDLENERIRRGMR